MVLHGKGLMDEYQAFMDILGRIWGCESWLADGEKRIRDTFVRPNLDRCINVGIFGFCRIKGNADTCAGFHITGGDILPFCKAGYGCAIASLKCDGICCMAYNCTDRAGKFPASKRIRSSPVTAVTVTPSSEFPNCPVQVMVT